MRTFDEHASSIADAILTARDMCGSEYRAIKDYFADCGFPPGDSPEKQRLTSKALDLADARWNEFRLRA